MALYEYEKQLQRFVHDQRQDLINPRDLTVYINRARRQIAMMTQSMRFTPPVSGPITSVSVTNGGSGYTAPTVTISTPDFPAGTGTYPNGAQATATATQIGGTIAAINLDFGGDGYFQPIAIINDPTGTGATATPLVTGINTVNQGQEEYFFGNIDLSIFPGVGKVYAILQNVIIYSSWRFALPQYSYSVYQAKIASYPFQYEYVPEVCCQRGQGTNGSIMMFPLPSQTYQWQPDCLALPQDLLTDNDFEALPQPWTDGVSYFAAHLCYLELQNLNSANFYLSLFEKQTGLYSRASRPGRAINPYGRWAAFWLMAAGSAMALLAASGLA